MKKKDRKSIIIKKTVIISFLGLIAFFAIASIILSSKKRTLNSNETKNIDYKVFIKENDFYKEEYLEENNEYVASIIDYIDVIFKYELELENENNKYDFFYRIVADVDVKNVTTKNMIYHISEDIIPERKVIESNDLIINDKIKIDYNKYNDLIKSFVSTFELSNVDSNLILKLYVTIRDNGKVINNPNYEVETFTIPLTTRTVAVNLMKDVKDNDKDYLIIENEKKPIVTIIIAFISITCMMIEIIRLNQYLTKTRTTLMTYNKEIKNILTNYGPFIQKITNQYEIGTSQVLKVDTFDDILEIRDTLQTPILMLENKTKTGSFFIIPAPQNIIYTYALRTVDIEARKKGEELPEYDISNINDIKIDDKKYTDEYIQKQIHETTSIPVVDDKNAIMGNKTKKDADIYEQLEYTQSFDIELL